MDPSEDEWDALVNSGGIVIPRSNNPNDVNKVVQTIQSCTHLESLHPYSFFPYLEPKPDSDITSPSTNSTDSPQSKPKEDPHLLPVKQERRSQPPKYPVPNCQRGSLHPDVDAPAVGLSTVDNTQSHKPLPQKRKKELQLLHEAQLMLEDARKRQSQWASSHVATPTADGTSPQYNLKPLSPNIPQWPFKTTPTKETKADEFTPTCAAANLSSSSFTAMNKGLITVGGVKQSPPISPSVSYSSAPAGAVADKSHSASGMSPAKRIVLKLSRSGVGSQLTVSSSQASKPEEEEERRRQETDAERRERRRRKKEQRRERHEQRLKTMPSVAATAEAQSTPDPIVANSPRISVTVNTKPPAALPVYQPLQQQAQRPTFSASQDSATDDGDGEYDAGSMRHSSVQRKHKRPKPGDIFDSAVVCGTTLSDPGQTMGSVIPSYSEMSEPIGVERRKQRTHHHSSEEKRKRRHRKHAHSIEVKASPNEIHSNKLPEDAHPSPVHSPLSSFVYNDRSQLLLNQPEDEFEDVLSRSLFSQCHDSTNADSASVDLFGDEDQPKSEHSIQGDELASNGGGGGNHRHHNVGSDDGNKPYDPEDPLTQSAIGTEGELYDQYSDYFTPPFKQQQIKDVGNRELGSKLCQRDSAPQPNPSSFQPSTIVRSPHNMVTDSDQEDVGQDPAHRMARSHSKAPSKWPSKGVHDSSQTTKNRPGPRTPLLSPPSSPQQSVSRELVTQPPTTPPNKRPVLDRPKKSKSSKSTAVSSESTDKKPVKRKHRGSDVPAVNQTDDKLSSAASDSDSSYCAKNMNPLPSKPAVTVQDRQQNKSAINNTKMAVQGTERSASCSKQSETKGPSQDSRSVRRAKPTERKRSTNSLAADKKRDKPAAFIPPAFDEQDMELSSISSSRSPSSSSSPTPPMSSNNPTMDYAVEKVEPAKGRGNSSGTCGKPKQDKPKEEKVAKKKLTKPTRNPSQTKTQEPVDVVLEEPISQVPASPKQVEKQAVEKADTTTQPVAATELEVHRPENIRESAKYSGFQLEHLFDRLLRLRQPRLAVRMSEILLNYLQPQSPKLVKSQGNEKTADQSEKKSGANKAVKVLNEEPRVIAFNLRRLPVACLDQLTELITEDENIPDDQSPSANHLKTDFPSEETSSRPSEGLKHL
ncbi:unnamed protein product [Calicophoron daubneyi]|uniref:Uncharacterized protein n=1 Tax=Calicophoron daubneyi TaxID=300641 RepID=A0AAV2TT08_CALDB